MGPGWVFLRYRAFASRAKSRYGACDPQNAKDGAQGRFGYDPFVLSSLWVTIKPKYVNMADVNLTARNRTDPQEGPEAVGPEPIWDIIELLFFAYRDFVSDPDEALAKFSFGRAHHRVLHFVNRNPGMKVADLLDVLRITKQSLGRVLKQLVDEGYVVQKEGPDDRRHRLLFVTPKGQQLAMKLAGRQTERTVGE